MKPYEQYDQRVDVTGLHCPQPVIHCKAALTGMAKGKILEFIASDRSSLSEIPRLVQSLGDEVITVCESAGLYRFIIQRNRTIRKGYRQHPLASAPNPGGGLRYCVACS